MSHKTRLWIPPLDQTLTGALMCGLELIPVQKDPDSVMQWQCLMETRLAKMLRTLEPGDLRLFREEYLGGDVGLYAPTDPKKLAAYLLEEEKVWLNPIHQHIGHWMQSKPKQRKKLEIDRDPEFLQMSPEEIKQEMREMSPIDWWNGL